MVDCERFIKNTFCKRPLSVTKDGRLREVKKITPSVSDHLYLTPRMVDWERFIWFPLRSSSNPLIFPTNLTLVFFFLFSTCTTDSIKEKSSYKSLTSHKVICKIYKVFWNKDVLFETNCVVVSWGNIEFFVLYKRSMKSEGSDVTNCVVKVI
jgi:hypothetical protein